MKPENNIIRSQRRIVYSLTIIFLILCLCLAVNFILALFRYPLENNLLASLILGFLVNKSYQEMHTQWFVLNFKIHWYDEDSHKEDNQAYDLD